MRKRLLIAILVLLYGAQSLQAQGRRNEKKILTYETLYDAHEINKLWVQFQPVYTELFVSNVTASYGVEASYYWADKFDFRVYFRKPYARQADYQRNISHYYAPEIGSKPNIFNFFEFGGTYHIKDQLEETETFIHLYSQRYLTSNKQKSMVPEKSKIPTKERKSLAPVPVTCSIKPISYLKFYYILISRCLG